MTDNDYFPNLTLGDRYWTCTHTALLFFEGAVIIHSKEELFYDIYLFKEKSNNSIIKEGSFGINGW